MLTRFVRLALAACLVTFLACSESDSGENGPVTPESDSSSSSQDTALPGLDTKAPDGPQGDGGTPGPTANPDATTDTNTGTENMCGEFGSSCTTNSDCCSEYCVETFNGFQCTETCVEDCPPGFECKAVLNSYPDIVTICVPNVSKLCRECEVDLQCNGGKCIEVGGGTFCTVDCSQEECPDGFLCTEATNGAKQCVPENGTCDCLENNAGAVRPCGVENEFGACTGVETCDPTVGWSACDALTPSEESCDGVDNDCDGFADAEFKDAQPCESENESGICVGIATCQGTSGWVCSADSPQAEICDFLDNDCDGTADEDFKTATGKYGTLHHCGGCGKDCEGLFPNGTAKCDETMTVPQCVVDECAPGFYQSNDYQCLPELDTLCQPCTADFQCGGGFCVTVAGGSFCSKPCSGESGCTAGFVCLATTGADGTPKGSGCMPTSGDCGCIPSKNGQKTPCSAANAVGECYGFSTCDGAVGWSACDASEPVPELCDGLDNDCNGLVDDGLPDVQPCEVSWPGIGTCQGEASCFGTAGWVCNAATPVVETCDYKDNNCDGQVDEPFKNADGKYAVAEHCGACGTDCNNAIPNATAACNDSGGTPTCVVDECAEGFYPVNDYLCLKEGESYCKVCSTDGQCDGKECVQVADGNFCTDPCAVDTDCPDGFACLSTFDPDLDAAAMYCVPDNGTCDCNTDTNGAKKPCEVINDLGTCVGFRVCESVAGWDTCTATQASPEICDGIDNDCNGLIDDGLPAEQDCTNENDFGSCAGTAICLGSQGWWCNASEPNVDVCDFLDNNCDGATDEDYKNAEGKYASNENCGTCGAQCGNNIPNALSEFCDSSKEKPQCVVDECNDGYFKLNEFQCIVQPDTVCLPCTEDVDCFGGSCIELSDGNACLPACVDSSQCADGFICDGEHCMPSSGTCDCTQATAGVKKFCSVENDDGTCVGFSVCDPSIGWGACDALTPAQEICDGVDNDCNGVPDDGLPANEPCQNENDFGTCLGESVCQGGQGWACQAQVPAEESCDFIDNNCNGAIDETFTDDQGKYISDEHCGTCNQACGGAIANSAIEICDTSKAVPMCIVTECLPGFFLKNELQCVPNPAVGCTPCISDDTCFGGSCQQIENGTFCLESCADGSLCKSGFSCIDDLCKPDVGSCDCNELTAGATRTCTNANGLGTCLGFETCDPDVGWSDCTASIPTPEECNGVDNNCNGLIDDGLAASQVCFNKNVYGQCAGTAQCFGSAGWVCLAETPGPEVCDFKDNDCDSATDEDYKDAAGKYTTIEHCGTCNNTCGDQYPHSLNEICDASKTVPQCVVDECEDGYIKLNDFQCLEVPEIVCEPCSSDANCFGATCTPVDQGNFCLVTCEDGACPDGYFCSEGLCRPDNGTCDCTEESAGNKRTCSINNNLGLCYGFETCEAEFGWVGCDAVPAMDEICNGLDDDCNGFIDDSLPATQLCEVSNDVGTCTGTASCFGTVGWFCSAPPPVTESCDYKDNDCDGFTDEDFKDDAEQYSSDTHCGGCNVNCDGAILNASSYCDATKPLPQCVVDECGVGWEEYNDYLCIPITSTLCEPCAVDENCVTDGAKCVQLAEGMFCGMACDADEDCPAAYMCLDAGIGESQCVPATGSCDCDGTNLDLQKACKQEFTPENGGPTQTCFGTNFCTPTGWSGCSLPLEQCNGLDDDCNGSIDEIFKDASGKYATDQHCGKCNRNCSQLNFVNGVGICDTSLLEPDCKMTCKDGFFDTNANPTDGCECAWVSDVDKPDGVDWNCDGIDGELNNAIFVAKTGNDANPGTIVLPKLTIQSAIDAAVSSNKRDVYVNTSVYSENIVLQPGVSVYGGFSADFTQRDILLYETAIMGVEPAGVVAAINATAISGVGEATVFDGFIVFGYSNTAPGQSSYAIYVRDSDSRLVIRNNRILAGAGGNGSPGTEGSNGVSGPSGSDGPDAKDLNSNCGTGQLMAAGGAAGTTSCNATVVSGGAGGAGYCPNYSTSLQNSAESGQAGSNGGGAGGGQGYDTIMSPSGGSGSCIIGAGCGTCIIPPNQLPMAGSDGANGPPGVSGSAGIGCQQSTGTFVSGLWQPASGSAGGNGGHGGGGGGGGAGNGVQTCSCSSSYGYSDLGGSGGGGGSGACGASGGQGGTGGGGSFGIFLFYQVSPTSAPIIESNAIRRGTGGLGGPGGNAGVGGLGGLGGKGGKSGTGSSKTFCAGKGGNGGKGGDGGQAGGGGGGCGGASYAIFAVGQTSADFTAIKNGLTLLPGGQAGGGGPGGLSLTNQGASGLSGVFDITNF